MISLTAAFFTRERTIVTSSCGTEFLLDVRGLKSRRKTRQTVTSHEQRALRSGRRITSHQAIAPIAALLYLSACAGGDGGGPGDGTGGSVGPSSGGNVGTLGSGGQGTGGASGSGGSNAASGGANATGGGSGAGTGGASTGGNGAGGAGTATGG